MTNATYQTILNALGESKDSIIEMYTAHINRSFNRLVEVYGNKLERASGSHTYYGMYSTLARMIKKDSDKHSMSRSESDATPYILIEERVLAAATEYAEAVIEANAAKIAEKLGEVESLSINYMNNNNFSVTAEKDGHKVAISQQVVFKVSPKGKPFNQWPASIYVDGKKTSAKAYKEQFAA